MRTQTLLAVAGLALVATGATACSGGSKPTAAASAAPVSATSVAASTGSSAASSGSSGGSAPVLDACTLLPLASASSLAGQHYKAAKPATIAPGQDQCTYKSPDYGSDLVVIIYQPGSGVTWPMMASVLKGTGTVKSVGGVGDKAMVGSIELDAQAGNHLVAVQGAGGTLSGTYSAAAAIAKAALAALH